MPQKNTTHEENNVWSGPKDITLYDPPSNLWYMIRYMPLRQVWYVHEVKEFFSTAW